MSVDIKDFEFDVSSVEGRTQLAESVLVRVLCGYFGVRNALDLTDGEIDGSFVRAGEELHTSMPEVHFSHLNFNANGHSPELAKALGNIYAAGGIENREGVWLAGPHLQRLADAAERDGYIEEVEEVLAQLLDRIDTA